MDQSRYSGVFVSLLSATFAWQYHSARWSAACQQRWDRAIGSLDSGILLQADLRRICALGKVFFIDSRILYNANLFQDQYFWLVDADGKPNRFYDQFHLEHEGHV